MIRFLYILHQHIRPQAVCTDTGFPQIGDGLRDHRQHIRRITGQPHILHPMQLSDSVKFIVAPHEMDESRINRLLAETLGGAVRYTQCTAETSFDGKQLLVLDTVGILSSAYGYAEWGYIGGGFGVGIHNTLEAATFGLPIAFGPNYEKFKEARDLVTLGAATPIHSYEELKTWFTPLRDDEHLLQQCSRIAKDYTTAHQGATNIVLHTVFGKPE